jgi:hypothetical protein
MAEGLARKRPSASASGAERGQRAHAGRTRTRRGDGARSASTSARTLEVRRHDRPGERGHRHHPLRRGGVPGLSRARRGACTGRSPIPRARTAAPRGDARALPRCEGHAEGAHRGARQGVSHWSRARATEDGPRSHRRDARAAGWGRSEAQDAASACVAERPTPRPGHVKSRVREGRGVGSKRSPGRCVRLRSGAPHPAARL